jgi:hypothetical protein
MDKDDKDRAQPCALEDSKRPRLADSQVTSGSDREEREEREVAREREVAAESTGRRPGIHQGAGST